MNSTKKNKHYLCKSGTDQNGLSDLFGLFADFQQKQYSVNQPIFTPMDPSNNIYFITNGKVKTTYLSSKGRAVGLDYYKRGDLFNLEAITQENGKKIIALSKSKNTSVIIIAKHDFLRKMSLIPELQKYVLDKLLLYKANAEKRILKFLEISSHYRVYDFLYQHVLKFGEKVGYEYVVRDPLTHKEISEYVGSSRQTVTTSMNDLRREGIFDFNRKYWIIRNFEGLKKIVEEI